MEDLPANLDDGELWLPSDIFPVEEPHHHHRHPIPTGRPCLEDLGRQFGNLNFLDHHRRILSSRPPSISEGLEVAGPIAQWALTAASPNGCYGVVKVGPGVDRGRLRACENDSNEYEYPIPPGPCQPLRYPIRKPHLHLRRPQAAEQHLMETRIASTRRVQGGQQQNRQQNRLFPFQGTGFGFSLGCFMQDCHGLGTAAGTGVFIPRANKITTYGGASRKPGVIQQRGAGTGRKLGMEKAEEYHCYGPQAASDVGLPKDWTY